MANENMGILGLKLGMTQMVNDKGDMVPVTVIHAEPNTVLSVKTDDGNDGYNSIQIGVGARKASQTTKAMAGHCKKAESSPKQHLREIRLEKSAASQHELGQELRVEDVFTVGEKVDVTGTGKGRGFAGVMKRHGMKGFQRTHGTHEFFRHGGSIGTRLTPGHVLKGKKMPGQMGNKRVTIQNLRVEKIDAEQNLVFIRGGIPGGNGTLVVVRKAVKA